MLAQDHATTYLFHNSKDKFKLLLAGEVYDVKPLCLWQHSFHQGGEPQQFHWIKKSPEWINRKRRAKICCCYTGCSLETALPHHTCLESIQKNPGRRKYQQIKHHQSNSRKCSSGPAFVSVWVQRNKPEPAPESIERNQPLFRAAWAALHFFILSASGTTESEPGHTQPERGVKMLLRNRLGAHPPSPPVAGEPWSFVELWQKTNPAASCKNKHFASHPLGLSGKWKIPLWAKKVYWNRKCCVLYTTFKQFELKNTIWLL